MTTELMMSGGCDYFVPFKDSSKQNSAPQRQICKKRGGEGIVKLKVEGLERRFEELATSFEKGKIQLMKVNWDADEIIRQYRNEASENLVGFVGCKRLHAEYDARVQKAYNNLMERVGGMGQ